MSILISVLYCVGIFLISMLASINGMLGIFILSFYLLLKNYLPLSSYDWSAYVAISLIFILFLVFRLKLFVLNIFPIMIANAVITIGFLTGRMFQDNFELYQAKILVGIALVAGSEYFRRNFFLLNMDKHQYVDNVLTLNIFELFYVLILSFLAGVFGFDLLLLFYIYLIVKIMASFDVIDTITLSSYFIICLTFLIQKVIAFESVFSEFITPKILISIALGSLIGYKFYHVTPVKTKARFVLYASYILGMKNLAWGCWVYFNK